MILGGPLIRQLGIVTPHEPRTEVVRASGLKLSYGEGPAGYDVRLDIGREYSSMHLRPGEFALAATVERFALPPDVLGVVHDKSSWARRGLAVQNTVLEPGWCGYLTLELANHGSELLYFQLGDPIAQIVFHCVDSPGPPYSGKYQDQAAGPQEAR